MVLGSSRWLDVVLVAGLVLVVDLAGPGVVLSICQVGIGGSQMVLVGSKWSWGGSRLLQRD